MTHLDAHLFAPEEPNRPGRRCLSCGFLALSPSAHVRSCAGSQSRLRSISDDDLCSGCMYCCYKPGALSTCPLSFPGTDDDDGYIVACPHFEDRT